MCGINGCIAINEDNLILSQDIEDKIHRMNDLISHRGPDSRGVFNKEPVCFGFRRLSIIDLSDDANQPMLSADGNIVIVFNGEIYNYVEIKQELINKGYAFKTKSDTEVIINSYVEYGTECVKKFNGMWAFAIYDFKNNSLFCSRDRLGVKPFYYALNNGYLFFSSELKTIHYACNLNKANAGKIYDYLAYGYRINDGETFFDNCNELLPGTNLMYDGGEIKTEQYWRLTVGMYQHDDNLNYHEEFVQLFEDAIKLRYRSDVPVALLLSGGLDSTSIAKVTDNLIEKGELKQNEIQAFTASFPGFVDDETYFVREFVKTCKHIKLHEQKIDIKDAIDDLEKIIYGFDHPVNSFNVVVHNAMMKKCNETGIKVVLNGQGSDEALAGYIKYISGAYLLDMLLSRKGKFLIEFKHLISQNNFSKSFLLSQMIKTILSKPYSSFLRAKYKEKSISCFTNEFVKENYNHYKSNWRFSLRGDNFSKYLLHQINYGNLNYILRYEDISSMLQSVEMRSPFLDYRMMEFAFSIQNELKLKNGISKVILRKTIGKMLPDSISENRKKIGFTTPFNDYITNVPEFNSYIFSILDSKSFTEKNIWNAQKIRKVFQHPEEFPNFPFWRIINLEIWSKVYNISNL